MTVKVNGKVIGEVTTNRSLTIDDVMYALGYDINSQEDCEKAYADGVEGFYLDDEGNYYFDEDSVKTEY